MPSKFEWMDFAEEDRQKMLDVVSLFREQDTRDELGIGTIRDAFADHFFPGTSTIQTRARYMLIIPWVYLELERKKTPSSEVGNKARKMETRIIGAILESGETQGVIGQDARDDLQRLPSNIYWAGLASWGIRCFPGSQAEYHRYMDSYYRQEQPEKHESASETNPYHPKGNWHDGIPKAPGDLCEKTALRLSVQEAEFLQERILIKHNESLFAKLILESNHSDVDFPWEHPITGKLASSLQSDLTHSRCFSEAIHGASMLYNLLLARAYKQREEWITIYDKGMEEWSKSIGQRFGELSKWHGSLREFWNLKFIRDANIPSRTRDFVNTWLNLLFSSKDTMAAASGKPAQSLIRNREISLKGKRARLDNQRALEQWQGASGASQIDYRWGNASVMVQDIIEGLKGTGAK
jgi:hypothetical protein